MLIRIIRDSIEENKNAGDTCSFISGKKSITFKCSEIPEILKEKVYVMCQLHNSEKCEKIISGCFCDDSILTNIVEILKTNMEEFKRCNFSLSVENEIQTIYHPPIPKYSYEFENPDIICLHCNSKIKIRDLSSDVCLGSCITKICPECGCCDCIDEDIKYEKIENIIGEFLNNQEK